MDLHSTSRDEMMLPPGAQPPPKRGRGRPPGTKNHAKKLGRPTLASAKVTTATVHPVVTSVSSSTTVALSGSSGIHPVPPVAPEMYPLSSNQMLMVPNLNTGIDQSTEISNETRSAAVQEIDCDSFESRIAGSVRFLSSVQNITAGEPHMYNQFLELLSNYPNLDIDTLSDQITAKFSKYPELIKEYYNWKEGRLAENGVQNSTRSVSNMMDDSILTYGSNYGSYRQVHQVSECPDHNQNQVWLQHQHAEQHPGTEGETNSEICGNVIKKDLRSRDIHEAKTLGDIALHAIKLYLMLESRFGKESDTYKTVSSVLSNLHENAHANRNLEAETRRVDLVLQRRRAYELIREALKDETALLEIVDAFFSSGQIFYNSVHESDGHGSSNAKVHVHKNHVEYVSENDTSNTHIEGATPTSFVSTEGNTGLKQASSVFAIDSTTTVSTPYLDVTSSKYALVAAMEAKIASCSDKNATVEEKLYRFLHLYFDETKWVSELVGALVPILMELSTLRNYIWNNHRALVFEHCDSAELQNDDNESENPTTSANNTIETVALNLSQKDLTSESKDVNMAEGSYMVHKDVDRLPICSGRASFCTEQIGVLNDEYYSVPSKRFNQDIRSRKAKRLDDYEDARYEVDMKLHHSAYTIEVFEEIKCNMSNMTEVELNSFQLGENLGASSILHRRLVESLFKDDDGLVIQGLREYPSLFVPGVLQILKMFDKEWIGMRGGWNSLISANINKMNRRRRKKTGPKVKYFKS